MNFEDPFADDLRGFRSTVGKQRRVSPSSRSPAPNAPAGGPQRSSGHTLPVFPPSVSAGSPLVQDSASSPFTPLSGGVTSLLGPSPNVEPVAGRRARLQPSASGGSFGPPSTTGDSSGPVTQIASPRETEAPVVSGLSWLDDTDASQAPAMPAIVNPGPLETPPPLRPTGRGLVSSSLPPSFPTSEVPQEQLPFFLNFASTGIASGADPVRSLPPMRASAPAAAVSTSTGGAVNSLGSVEERRRKELSDLFITFDALDMEQQRLEERIDSFQVKEETELLTLETNALLKATELEGKEQELTSKRLELIGYTSESLDAMTSRYAKEMEAQAAEMRALDGACFEEQLQRIINKRRAVEEAVHKLREQVALVLEAEPFGETGVRLSLNGMAAHSVVATPGKTDLSDSTAVAVEASSAKSTAAQLETTLQQAVAILQGYCDKRLRHTRDNLVGYVHNSTLDVAHSVRRGREQMWVQDAVQHKQLFSRHMMDMMQRYIVFYKERARRKEDNMATLHADARRVATELRSQAAERLQQLLRDVTAKISLSTQHHTEAAEKACALLQKKANAVVEGDMAMADTQRRELESRLLAEAGACRQRHHAEEESLTEQLQRLRRVGEDANRTTFQALVDAAGATSRGHAQPLKEEVLALKSRLLERLRGGEAALASAFSPDRLHAEELAHAVRSAVALETTRQNDASFLRQQCADLRRSVTSSCTEMVERLQQARSVQHAHQARVDALVKTWEAAHRQNLLAPCSLILPVSSSESGATDAEFVSDTYAAPQHVVSTALLDVLQNKLRARDELRRTLLESQRRCTAACLGRLEKLRDAQVALKNKYAALWSTAQNQGAQQNVTQEMAWEVEKGLITVAVEHRVVERDRRATQRECRRITAMMSRLRHEVPPHLLNGSLSLSYQGLASAMLEAVTPHMACTQVPGGVDIDAARNSSSIGNSLTAATCPLANVATAPRNNSVGKSLPHSSFSPSQVRGELEGKRGEEMLVSGQRVYLSHDSAEASGTSNTQPWSSALLRAEQRALHAGADESSDVLRSTSDRPHARPRPESAHMAKEHGAKKTRTREALTPYPRGIPQVQATEENQHPADTPVEVAGDACPRNVERSSSEFHSDTVDESRRKKTSAFHASFSALSNVRTVGLDATVPACNSSTATSPAAFPTLRQQTVNVNHATRNPSWSQSPWSTPEEERIGHVNASDSSVTNGAGADMYVTSNFTGTGSLEEWGDFLALLSITNSTTSSFIS